MSGQTSSGIAATNNENEALPHLSRTPRPYSHTEQPKTPQRNARPAVNLPSPALTPLSSDSERSRARPAGESPDDSGTEADDEALSFTRALPAPSARPRKGLKLPLRGFSGDTTPFLTPSQLNEESSSPLHGYFGEDFGEEELLRREKFTKRRRAELLRRGCELVSFTLVGAVVFNGQKSHDEESIFARQRFGLLGAAIASPTRAALSAQICSVLSLMVLYPIQLLLVPLLSGGGFRLGAIEIPATFDTAPLLYPSVLPVLIAMSVFSVDSSITFANITLGLSALPAQLIPNVATIEDYNPIHWLVTLIPTFFAHSLHPVYNTSHVVRSEILASLFPLHHTLLPILQHLTTTSLLSSEVQLLSIALINVLFMSESPQSTILMILLWLGGLGLFILCSPVLRWNVALERIPNWRFRRGDSKKRPTNSFRSELLRRFSHVEQTTARSKIRNPKELKTPGRNSASKPASTLLTPSPAISQGRPRSGTASSIANGGPNSTVIGHKDGDKDIRLALRRTQTTPTPSNLSSKGKKLTLSMSAQAYLSMTLLEVEARKWSYAIYTYAITLLLIFVPIRSAIASKSLQAHDPFGWAIGYLFGDIPAIREFVSSQELEEWIYLSPLTDQKFSPDFSHSGWAQHLRYSYGVSNTRLMLFGYWAIIVTLGVATVLQLSSVADVDTRRKVFHGMMVVMLLPTTYIDPCFLSLALVLVLAVFLLLDLFRAAQLRPLSKPLARFLTPYVDGRDLRGPVVISHIFLLIGCAIPFWLSLADVQQVGDGWEVATRDVSMIAGVVCVGMGDAAASLIGRRYGRRKWPWAGGKSLEGSAAFAAAVTIGLLLGKAWLRIGGWKQNDGAVNHSWSSDIGKAVLSASGASFTEAVLTGANDNVVVPVILWLLVKGLRL